MATERLRLRDVRRTTPFRLSLLLGSLFLAGILATLVLGYVLTARELTARSDRLLFERTAALQRVPASALPSRIRTEIENAPPGFSYFALRGADGEQVVGNILLSPALPRRSPFTIDARPGNHGPLRVLERRTAGGETIVVARDISQVYDLRRRLLSILAASGLFSTAATLTIAVLLSLAPLRRVRDLRRASQTIAAGDLSQRMPIAGRHDEPDQFAATANLMIDEVAHVVAQVKTATDAIAHDLRTPLTRVRAALHRMQRDNELAPHQKDLAARAVADLDSVLGRFAALLRIAELEASERRAGLVPVELAAVLIDVADLYEPLADERGVLLKVDNATDRCIHADPDLLVEAIGNLVDNATKFARTEVLVRVIDDGAGPVVEVHDDGSGIPEDERAAVTRRFHRARGAAGVEGSGLGLAVVTAIAHLHGFMLEFADARPGLIARLHLDKARSR